MNYFLGIDGGGTSTSVIVIDENNQVVFKNKSGPTSIDTVSNDVTFKNLKEAIKPFVDSHKDIIFKSIFAGIGDIVYKKDMILVEKIIRKLPLVNELTFVTARNDMENALYSGGNYTNGMALICGTGTVAYGRKGKKRHKCGGWGFQEGGLGSAYHLGKEALRYCIRAFDKRYMIDDFASEVANEISLANTTHFIKIMQHLYGKRTEIAGLAKIVTKHANLNNKYAKAIVDKATDELALSVKGVYNYLEFDEVTLVIIGSLGNSKGYFGDSLIKKINNISTNIKIVKPIMEPAMASCMMAKDIYKRLDEKK